MAKTKVNLYYKNVKTNVTGSAHGKYREQTREITLDITLKTRKSIPLRPARFKKAIKLLLHLWHWWFGKRQ